MTQIYLSRNRLEIQPWVQWTTNRKWPIGIRWSHDPESKVMTQIFEAHYLENGWRYGLGANGAPIGNGYLGTKWSRD